MTVLTRFRCFFDTLFQNFVKGIPLSMKSAALLIGLNYANATMPDVPELHATIHDIHNVESYLKSQKWTDISVITDVKGPITRARFLKARSDFAAKSRDDKLDTAFLYYSGHGTNIPTDWISPPSREQDGKDECIVASDDIIVDNEVRSVFARINPATHFVFVADCCNSGTIADLQYMYPSADKVRFDPTVKHITAKVIVLSGCKDDETSGEGEMTLASSQGKSRQPSGFLTGCLLNLLQADPLLGTSMLQLFSKVQEALDKMSDPSSPQTPQLNCSFKLQASTKFL